jgi:HEPN domain-containing protein
LAAIINLISFGMSNHKNQVPDFLLHMAQGFYEVGLLCANDPFKDKPIKGFQRLAPAAVNLSFSAELLLKGILLITSKKAIRGHNLETLFGELQQPLRTQIEERYNYYQKADKDDKEIGSYILSVAKATHKSPPQKSDTSLKTFLKVHCKTFEIWRYLHEIGKDGYTLEINFKSMHCFMKGMIDTINSTSWRQKFYPVESK